MPGGNLVLGFFDHLAFKFLNTSTFDADKMVVVFLLDLVACDPIIESALRRESGFDEKFHRPIHRGVSDIRVLLSHALIEIFARNVSLGLEKGREDQITLLRVLEVILFQVGGERLHLDFVRHTEEDITLCVEIPRCPFARDSSFAPGLVEQVFGPRRKIIIEVLG